jgi:Dihydrofolate reductase
MKKVVLLMHVSLDGFVAGPNGEMDWIRINDTMFEFVDTLTHEADTALYGRKTFDMMQAYWPTADQSPDAKGHTVNHARWYRQSLKLVVSNTLQDAGENTRVVSGNITQQMQAEKQQGGKNILMIGSPSAVHHFTRDGLIDDYWLFVNPVVLGAGIPLFNNVQDKINLNLVETKQFDTGVVALHYQKA